MAIRLADGRAREAEGERERERGSERPISSGGATAGTRGRWDRETGGRVRLSFAEGFRVRERSRASERTDGRTNGRPVLSISLRTGRGSCITYGEAGMPVAAR
jgi:hypothetical protein